MWPDCTAQTRRQQTVLLERCKAIQSKDDEILPVEAEAVASTSALRGSLLNIHDEARICCATEAVWQGRRESKVGAKSGRCLFDGKLSTTQMLKYLLRSCNRCLNLRAVI